MKEKWVEIPESPRHAVSNKGRVLNTWNDVIQKPMINQAGIAYVRLSFEGRQHTKSVASLVIHAFMQEDRPSEYFDTPIHLNGDKTDCRVENLAWRPRWFAVKYHQQFKPWERTHFFGYRRPVRIAQTGEEFPTSWEAAIKYGLLDRDIFLSIMNLTHVFPTNQRFVLID